MLGSKSLLKRWLRVAQTRKPHVATRSGSETPLRAELFSAEQMEQRARVLASTHKVGKARPNGMLPGPLGDGNLLLSRLRDNEAVLLATIRRLTEVIGSEQRITPACEWLLDNFYLIEEQIRTARRHLPKGYSRELPRLLQGPSAGLPRVYDIALETIAHGDGRVDPDILSRFIGAYQSVSTLNLGELWAIPIMLRLALIENLRRVGARIAADSADRELATIWSEQMLQVAEADPKGLILVIADMARSDPPVTSAFVAELARRLQGQSPALALPLTWVEQRLAEFGLSIEQSVRVENQNQAADQVSISNSIGSLRLLGVPDWRDFVESLSVVEKHLRRDPVEVYGAMDFGTRDHYRHVIEDLAKRSDRSEEEVAAAAVALAQKAADEHGLGDRRAHVGYFLIDRGRAQMDSARTPLERLEQWIRSARERPPLVQYLGWIAVLSVLMTAALCAVARDYGATPPLLALCALLAILPASQLAVTLVNWTASLLSLPQTLPRMDYSKGLPADARTLVAVPTLLTSLGSIDALVEALEVRFLGNRDAEIKFALLSDFTDAPSESLPTDAALLDYASARIEELNRKYADGADSVFYLLHRPRRLNAQEGVWMGWERKRGKLAELNALLRGHGRERFLHVVGDLADLGNIRYVITLDSDTQLPREAARRFVSTLAHPLNRPRLDPTTRCIKEGYGILQPRAAPSVAGALRTRYAQLHGGDAGIDPYTRAVSDVYQDLFAEGSFIGKGIYEVDAFEQALSNRFPDNRILSHDLLEGCYARSGLLSDAPLYEDYPERYFADIDRRHRWIRGDWQIAAWLLRRVPGPDGSRERNPLSALSQWKILDNLRRSLVAPATLALAVFGWFFLAPAWVYSAALLGMLGVPALFSSLLQLLRKPHDAPLRQHLLSVLDGLDRDLARAGVALACLPFEAASNLDAIMRTAWRTLVSKRRLLEWTASSEVARRPDGNLGAIARRMWIAPFLGIASALGLALLRPAALLAAAPLLLLWLTSPLLVWWLNQPRERRQAALSDDQRTFLRQLARRTFAFFEAHVSADDNFLPPDNFQEHPVPVVAHRTSPTNMGMALLANFAAWDFGYLSAGRLLERTNATLASMGRLERHRGHFYNWYDTQSLAPLLPAYVSSVDSGNLAGHLLTLRVGLDSLADEPLVHPRMFAGMGDGLAVLRTALDAPLPAAVEALSALLARVAQEPPATLGQWHTLSERLVALAGEAARELDAAPNPAARAQADALAQQCADVLTELRLFAPIAGAPESPWRVPSLRELGAAGHPDAQARLAQIESLLLTALDFASPDWRFLYDQNRHLLAIGYNVTEIRRDPSFYDLLASEARLAVFVGIAQGQLAEDAWFALGRLLTRAGGQPILLSWSGSMFEYLMPLLVMPNFEDTLLDQTNRAAVLRQIEYGRARGVPWGISESGYNTVDAAQNYQYRAFGVPGLGLQRGLAEDLVIAPYASALALMVEPEAACSNLMVMAERGYLGRYGFYEAIDYTQARLRPGQTEAIVRSWMAHHQGMSLIALGHVLLDRPMQRRFESDPMFQATMLLLQERIPRATAQYSNNPQLVDLRVSDGAPEMPLRVFSRPDTSFPAVQLLSNGRYHVMLTHAGGGYSRWKDLGVTRWREDTTRDPWGSFCYLQDVQSGRLWSTAFQPTSKATQTYEAIFTEARVEYQRRDAEFDTHTEIVVSPEDDIELRRTRLTNRTRARRSIDITSYAEVLLAPAIADAMHPAFSNLFVQTEILESRGAILCTRRPRSRHEAVPWMFHLLSVHAGASGGPSFETDRLRFIGRGRSPLEPQALRERGALGNTQGSVLDPIVAIRQRIQLEPQQSVSFDLISGMADSREAALALIDKYQDRRFGDRVFEMAWTHSHVVLRQLNVTEADAQLYGRLASSILYANAALRAESAVIARNRRGQNGLWGYAISGDLPIVLLQIKEGANIDLVRQLVQAHAYWRLKGLSVDLVIWNEDRGGYRQVLQDQIMGLIAAGVEASFIDRPGGIFVRSADQISNEDRVLLKAVARAVFSDGAGTLAEQIRRKPPAELPIPRALLARPAEDGSTPAPVGAATAAIALTTSASGNGIGEFTADGREFVITLAPGRSTPLPWVNVLANRWFGSVVSESGGAYTWHENAHEYRLSPWHNDPVGDSSGEAIYLRDEDSGRFWSPSPAPRRGSGDYRVRHGFGYSVFEHTEDGIVSELWVYVAPDAAVKYSVIKLRNQSGRARRLSATAYVEWVLGDLRGKTAMHVVSEVDPTTGALFAHNSYNPEFAELIAFLDVDEQQRSFTCDRGEFIGRNGDLSNPAALARTRLSGRVGAAMDPCAAIQVPIELADGQSHEIIVRLGVGRGPDDTARFAQRLRQPGTARAALAAIHDYWNRTLGAVQIETPDPGLNAIGNGWLLYQTIACRIWARSGFYQSGGAFGFRDQLQDVMALMHADPGQARAHLLLCASRQFLEGDVQHWWHPPSGRGVRTRCSDDFLWLPLSTCRYVATTGDTGVLDESAGFLDGRAVGPEEESYYDLPLRVGETASLYQHCVRAVLHGLRFGERGLPLMGAGDWNDGMNNVGIHGRGESVWLGFFLYSVLVQFADLAENKSDAPFATRCREEAARLKGNLDAHAWDGEWYRRAYYDDGTPLGTAQGEECQIDSIAQSWSVLSGAGDPERARHAMQSLDRRLVRRDAKLLQLLDPPFDTSPHDPGYIRGYVPGVRENGGQYTHAAVWATMAFAELGDVEKAWELLDLINPVNHAKTPAAMARYAAEPYVLAGDVYAVTPHTGRGGWSWYTGSAGWMYRLIVESLLGLRREGDTLHLKPLLRADWPGFKLRYRYRDTAYWIEIKRDAGATQAISLSVDGVVQAGPVIALVDDRVEHKVVVLVR